MSAQFNPTDFAYFKENQRQERIKRSLALNPEKRHFIIDPSIMSSSPVSPTSSSFATFHSQLLPIKTTSSSSSSSSSSTQLIPSKQPSSSSSSTNFNPGSHPMKRTHTNHPNSISNTGSYSSRGRSTRIKPLNRFHPSIDSEFRSRNSKEWDLWISRGSEMKVENDSFNESQFRRAGLERKIPTSYDDQWKSWVSTLNFSPSISKGKFKSSDVEDDAFYDAQTTNFFPSSTEAESKLPYTVETLEFQVPEDFFSSLRQLESLDILKGINTDSQLPPYVDTLPKQNSKFAPAPRNKSFSSLLPIMSRLPPDFTSPSQLSLEEELISKLENSTDYLSLPNVEVPYTRSHLPILDETSLALWKTLHDFRAIRKDYGSGYLESRNLKTPKSYTSSFRSLAPHPISSDSSIDQCPAFTSNKSLKAMAAINKIKQSFNWDELLLDEDLEGKWYGVAFRSARKIGSESLNLYEADRKSHEEAVNSGGLMMYWYGTPSEETGENLATCIWTDRHSARQASSLPLHAEAAKHARPAYQVYDLTRYSVLKVKGEKKLRIQTWEDDEE